MTLSSVSALRLFSYLLSVATGALTGWDAGAPKAPKVVRHLWGGRVGAYARHGRRLRLPPPPAPPYPWAERSYIPGENP
jgi:hypothetical protein